MNCEEQQGRLDKRSWTILRPCSSTPPPRGLRGHSWCCSRCCCCDRAFRWRNVAIIIVVILTLSLLVGNLDLARRINSNDFFSAPFLWALWHWGRTTCVHTCTCTRTSTACAQYNVWPCARHFGFRRRMRRSSTLELLGPCWPHHAIIVVVLKGVAVGALLAVGFSSRLGFA